MPASSNSVARIKFWGVRGSIPVPGPRTLRYGGNTSCVEFRADDEIIVLDAGTGIRELGHALEKEFGSQPIKLSLLITHVHWDHIQGFPFFVPAYREKNQLKIFGYDGTDGGLREILKGQMALPFFPVALNDLRSRIDIQKPDAMDFTIGKVRVRSRLMNHPGVCVGYRLEAIGGAVAFLPDTEPYDSCILHSARSESINREQTQRKAREERDDLVAFLNGTDILILDVQYTDEEYRSRAGWGHGSIGSAVSLAVDARVKKLVLFHHDPDHDDAAIDEMINQARALASKKAKSLEIIGAREGDELLLSRP